MISIPGKIPVYISPVFWLLAGAIGWISTMTLFGTFIWMCIILISVLVHEYGHALTAVAFGQTARIELVGFGGVTHRRGAGKLPMWKDFLIVLNGPIAGLALSAFCLWLNKRFFSSNPESLAAHITFIAYAVNLFWTFVNLLPIMPLDGGKLLSIVLEALFGLKGTKIALFISVILSSIIGIYFFAIREFLPGSLFFLFTYESFKAWKESLALTENDQSYIIQHLMKEGEKDLRSGSKEDALKKFLRVRDATGSGVLYQSATENAALILAQQGEESQSWELLKSLKNPGPDAIALLQSIAFHQGKYDEAIKYGEQAYRNRQTYDIALTNAMAHAQLKHVSQTIGWLTSAAHTSKRPLGDVLERKEFDPIRNDPSFRAVIEGNS